MPSSHLPPSESSLPPSSPPSSPSSHSGSDSALLATRRELNRVRSELAEVQASAGEKRRRPKTYVTHGRAIRRYVSAFQPLDAITSEADRRLAMEDSLDEDTAGPIEQRNRDRTYDSYKILCQLIPALQPKLDTLEDDEKLSSVISELQRGANEARSDDNKRIKEEMAGWINKLYPLADFSPHERSNRGLQNDYSAHLLFPPDKSFDDPQVVAAVRDGSDSIADNYFPNFLYKYNMGDPEDLDVGFLQGRLLIKATKALFTSPSSARQDEDNENDENEPPKKRAKPSKGATRRNVASLANVSRVTPRMIAYVAVMCHFNLTDATHWMESYNGFSYPDFYDFIVDYFEDPQDEAAKKHAESLLKWWNRQIFPSAVQTQTDPGASKKRLAAQRTAKRLAQTQGSGNKDDQARNGSSTTPSPEASSTTPSPEASSTTQSPEATSKE